MRRTIKGDITQLKVDVVVNAANTGLLGGGGVDGAIHKAAGPELLEECKTLGGCETGQAKITKGYNLPAKYIIHAVGPVWKDGKHRENELLEAAYRNSLEIALKHGCKTIAFPAISTGVYNFPKRDAAEIAIRTCQQFLQEIDDKMDITFVCFDDINYMVYKEICPTFNKIS